MIKQNSIRRLLIISLIVLSIGPLLMLSGIISWESYFVQQLQAKNIQHTLTKLAVSQIRSYIHEQESVLSSVVKTGNLLSKDGDRQYNLLSMLLSNPADAEHRDIFDELALLDDNGKELIRVSRSSIFTCADLGERSQIDEFVIPVESGEVYYSPVSFNEGTGEPYLKMGIPISDLRTMQVNGVLVAKIRLKYIWDVIEDIRVGESGIAYMLDHNGRVLAHPNPSVVLKGTQFRIPEQSGVTTGLKGTKVVLATEKLMLGNQLFFVITEQPVAEAFKYTTRLILSIIAFLFLSLSCAVALGLVLIRKIISPIESLSATSMAINAGNLSEKSDITGNDEIGILANSFNSMTSQLVENIESLEQNIVERKKADDQICQKNELLNNILNALSHPFYVVDVDTHIVKLANPAARFGSLSENSTCYFLTHNRNSPCRDEEHQCVIDEIKKTGKPVTLEHVHYDTEGNPHAIEVHGFPIFDSHGKVAQVIEYNLDISERKKVEDKLRVSVKEKELLLRELHHRVKNNMQIILSLLNLQSKKQSKKNTIEILRDTRNRIRSMALIHEKLYISEDMERVDFGSYISELAKDVLRFSETDSSKIAFKLEAEKISVGLDTAIPCGLIINELVTNALSHAFPDSRKGEIRIIIKYEDDEIVVSIYDNGVGIPENLDFRNTKSLGLHLVTTLSETQLRGKIELVRTEGTEFRIRFKEIKYSKRV